MATSFKRSCAPTVVFSDPDPAVSHGQPMPPLETPGHSQASLAQSLVGSLLLFSGSWCTQGFFVPSKSLSSQSCVSSVIKSHWPAKSNSLGEFLVPLPDLQVGKPVLGPRTFLAVQEFLALTITVLQFVGYLLGGSMVGLIVTSSKKAYATCCVTQVCSTQSP